MMTNHRLHPTLVDYIAVAINPVLVMGLIGSLIYFLLEVLYQGYYPDRLQFCLSMFILGTVLISRIAMEDGYEHAAPFGVGLAIVVALALNKFVDYGQGTLASFGWAINWGLMALTWWCAHQLTWDCTILDEAAEPESQGLLETVGIDKATGEPAAPEPAEPAASDSNQRRGRVLAGWEQVLNRKGKPHAPGVWVVYFSLASLPIFGIGQLCIPASNTASRRYVFGLLCVYVACGLGLLLTTSFLALRRYLRRRRLEMPPIMAGTWLVTGAVLIVVLLLFVALLPRPNPEYAISELPLRFSSAEQSSSKLAVGEEGTNDAEAKAGSGRDHAPDAAERDNERDGDGKQPSADGQNSSAAGEKGEASGANGKSQEKAGGTQAGKSAGGKQKADDKAGAADKSQAQGKQSPDGQKAQGQPQQSQARQTQSQNDSPKSQPGQQNDAAEQSPNSPPSSPPSGSPPAMQEISSAIGGFLATIFKWVFYAVVIAAAAYFAWQSRETLLAILQDWVEKWRKFWDELWGRRAPAGDGTALAGLPVAKPQQRFADFVDPFAAGSAGRYVPAELVKYTFAALEAWGRDHGTARLPEVTPHEFARQIGGQFQPAAAGARTLADLYCRALYAQGDLAPDSLDHVRRLWQVMRSIDARLIASVARP